MAAFFATGCEAGPLARTAGTVAAVRVTSNRLPTFHDPTRTITHSSRRHGQHRPRNEIACNWSNVRNQGPGWRRGGQGWTLRQHSYLSLPDRVPGDKEGMEVRRK